MIISVRDFSVSLGDFSLTVPRWELPGGTHLLIEGPSGSGKTTFLHVLAGLIPLQKGTVSIGNQQLSALSFGKLVEFRRNFCGIIFQRIHLLPHLTLEENVHLGAKSKDHVNRVPHFLEKLQLSHRKKHLPSELSFGEAQRAAVARALVSEPELILADEPTSSLDDRATQVVMNLLVSSARNKSLVVISHDSRVRDFMSQRINFGEIAQ